MKKNKLKKIDKLLKIFINSCEFKEYFKELNLKNAKFDNNGKVTTLYLQKLFILHKLVLKINNEKMISGSKESFIDNYVKEFEFIQKLVNEKRLLPKSQKNLHIVWNGKISDNIIDHIRVIANVYYDFRIKIWTDNKAFLIRTLKEKIIENTISPASAVILQNVFYGKYYQNYKSFDENAKDFMINNLKVDSSIVNLEYEKCVNSFKNAQIIFKNERFNNIIFLDFNSLSSWKNPQQKNKKLYIQNYLSDLYLRQSIVASSDFFRFYVLNEQGGIYIDPDLLPLLNMNTWANSLSKEIRKNKKKIAKNDYEKLKFEIKLMKNINFKAMTLEAETMLFSLNNAIVQGFKFKANGSLNTIIEKETNILKRFVLKIIKTQTSQQYKNFFIKQDYVSVLNNFAYFPGKFNIFNCYIVSLRSNSILERLIKNINLNFDILRNLNFHQIFKPEKLVASYYKVINSKDVNNNHLIAIINSRFEYFIPCIASTIAITGGKVLYKSLLWERQILNDFGIECSYYKNKAKWLMK